MVISNPYEYSNKLRCDTDNPQLSVFHTQVSMEDESSTTIDQLMYSRNPVQLVSRVQLMSHEPMWFGRRMVQYGSGEYLGNR